MADETGIDCGGNTCEDCECLCDCTNGIQDGLEDYIDCGGPNCEHLRVGNHVVQRRCPVLRRRHGVGGIGRRQPPNHGMSLTGAQVGFVVAEPADGWYNGYVIALNPTSLPQAAAYNSTAGLNYTTLFGGNTTVLKSPTSTRCLAVTWWARSTVL